MTIAVAISQIPEAAAAFFAHGGVGGLPGQADLADGGLEQLLASKRVQTSIMVLRQTCAKMASKAPPALCAAPATPPEEGSKRRC